MKARRVVELFCMMEDYDIQWYDWLDEYFDADLNNIPLQSNSYGTPVTPLGKQVPMCTVNEGNDLHMEMTWDRIGPGRNTSYITSLARQSRKVRHCTL